MTEFDARSEKYLFILAVIELITSCALVACMIAEMVSTNWDPPVVYLWFILISASVLTCFGALSGIVVFRPSYGHRDHRRLRAIRFVTSIVLLTMDLQRLLNLFAHLTVARVVSPTDVSGLVLKWTWTIAVSVHAFVIAGSVAITYEAYFCSRRRRAIECEAATRGTNPTKRQVSIVLSAIEYALIWVIVATIIVELIVGSNWTDLNREFPRADLLLLYFAVLSSSSGLAGIVAHIYARGIRAWEAVHFGTSVITVVIDLGLLIVSIEQLIRMKRTMEHEDHPYIVAIIGLWFRTIAVPIHALLTIGSACMVFAECHHSSGGESADMISMLGQSPRIADRPSGECTPGMIGDRRSSSMEVHPTHAYRMFTRKPVEFELD